MLIPTGHRSFLNNLTGTPARVLGAGNMPVNFLGDDGATWSPIELRWDVVTPTRWRAVQGDHRAVVDSMLGIQYSKRDASGVWHRLGMQPRFLVKLRRSDLTWSNLATAASPAITIAGGVLNAANVFPDIDLQLDYFNESYTHRWVFHQAARTALAGAGPWAGHLIGIVTELDPSQMTAQWRDSAGTFDPNLETRFHSEWIDVHVGGERVFALAANVLQYDAFDLMAPNPIPVYKFIGKRSGKWWLIELFDPTLTAAIPAGDLWHNVTFGNTTQEATDLGISQHVDSLLAAPASDGTADSISAYIRNFGGFFGGNDRLATCALYTDASPPLGSSAVETEEKTIAKGNAIFAWFTFDFTSGGPSITNGTNYNIAIWAADDVPIGSPVKIKCISSAGIGTDKYDHDETYGGAWPDLTGTTTALRLSIYCTYTETPTGPPIGSLALLGVGR